MPRRFTRKRRSRRRSFKNKRFRSSFRRKRAVIAYSPKYLRSKRIRRAKRRRDKFFLRTTFTVSKPDIQVESKTPGHNNAVLYFTFAPQQEISQWTSYTNLYKKYKVRKIIVKIRPKFDNMDQYNAIGAGTSYAQSGAIVSAPIHDANEASYYDQNSGAPALGNDATLPAVQMLKGSKTTYGARAHIRSVVPSVWKAYFAFIQRDNAVNVNDTRIEPLYSPWLDLLRWSSSGAWGQSNDEFQGLVVVFDSWVAVTGAANQATSFSCELVYCIDFKERSPMGVPNPEDNADLIMNPVKDILLT